MPAHGDRSPSCSVSQGAKGALVKCQAGCSTKDVLAALNLTEADLFDEAPKPRAKAKRKELEHYDYTDEARVLLYQVVRMDPKAFVQRRPDGNGGYIYNLGDTRRVLYRLPRVLAAVANDEIIYIAEGEKDVHAIEAAGGVGTCNPGGAGKWRAEYGEALRGADVIICVDKDEPGYAHGRAVADALEGVARRVCVVEPTLGKDVAEHLGAGHSLDALTPLREPKATTLAEVVAVFRKWLHLPDPGVLYVVLATIAANRPLGDAVWLLVVGPPSSGKTEIIGALSRLPDIYPAATLTEAALLSGTSVKDRAKGAKGGLLRRMGAFGMIVLKDFGSVLSMNREARAAVLAALREVYDGSWTRLLGVDGGTELHWEGKVGLVAGCTPAIDSHHAVMGTMGERFALYRVRDLDEEAMAARAFMHIGHEAQMRAELAEAVAGLFAGLHIPDDLNLTLEETVRLGNLAIFAGRCRSPVERHAYSREIELVPEPEAPGRLSLVLGRMFGALRVIGLDETECWRLVTKIALDSMPVLRFEVLRVLMNVAEPQRVNDIARAVQYPNTTTKRALEDLTAHGVLQEGEAGGSVWFPSEWCVRLWPGDSVTRNVGTPENDEPF